MNARLQLILIALAFFLPVVLAIWLNGWWKPTATKNHGELVQPIRHLSDFRVPTAEGKIISERDERGHWLLVQAVESHCDTVCETLAAQLRNLHVGLGEKAYRVRRILWTTEAGKALLPEAYPPPLRYIWPDVASMRQASQSVLQHTGGHEILLIDPRGYIALRYPAGFDIHGLRKDLNRLLTYAKEDELIDIPQESTP